jgi:hypothetical protein
MKILYLSEGPTRVAFGEQLQSCPLRMERSRTAFQKEIQTMEWEV